MDSFLISSSFFFFLFSFFFFLFSFFFFCSKDSKIGTRFGESESQKSSRPQTMFASLQKSDPKKDKDKDKDKDKESGSWKRKSRPP